MKLTINTLLKASQSYNIPIKANEILTKLTYNKNNDSWSLRLFNTLEDSASVQALYTESNTKTIVNNIEYAKTQSKKPLLFIKKQLLGTNTEKLYSNVRYHHNDSKGHRDNRKTELILNNLDVTDFINQYIDLKLLDSLHNKLLDYFNAKLSLDYLTPERLLLISEANKLYQLEDSLEKTIAQLKCAQQLKQVGGL